MFDCSKDKLQILVVDEQIVESKIESERLTYVSRFSIDGQYFIKIDNQIFEYRHYL